MAIKKRKITPRQKMINLMYIVLMAMLALNVSSDVLDAFSMVDESLTRSTKNSTEVNKNIYEKLDVEYKKNRAKAEVIYQKASNIGIMANALYEYIDSLKWMVAREVDGKNADIHNIKHRDNLEAGNQIMLSPVRGKGDELKASIDRYRDKILEVVVDPIQKQLIADNLTTEVPSNSRGIGKSWKEYLFENTPSSAVITILSKLQSDVRFSETQVLHELINNSDLDIDLTGKRLHVNEIDAYVIPNSTTIVRGSKFRARVVVGSIDTTQHPQIYVGNTLLQSEDGTYEAVCGTTGNHSLSGYILSIDGDGKLIKKEFRQDYTVVEPAATVSATMLNMLYAGYSNPVSVSVPGVPDNQVSLTMTGGTLRKEGNGKYIAVPSSVGQDVTFTVTANQDGRSTTVGTFPFRVRKLPDPKAYIEYTDANGTSSRYMGGKKSISKKSLVNSLGVSAAIDDGILDIPFKVVGFTTYFVDRLGDEITRRSESGAFTSQQKSALKSLKPGTHFTIAEIEVIGPDGIKRTLDTAIAVKIK